jgi:sugar phosphate isomerase/epimerase
MTRSAAARIADLGMCPASLLVNPLDAGPADTEEVFAATALAGCTSISTWRRHLPDEPSQLTERGLRVVVLESAVTWVNGSTAEADAEADDIVGLAVSLGAPLILAYAVAPELNSPARSRRNFQRLVRTAEQAGCRICLEFLPFGAIPSLTEAWRWVEPLGPAAALNLDNFHLGRQNGGPAYDLLATLPGDRVAMVQLCDTAPEPMADVKREALESRRLPGEGATAFTEFFAALAATGADPFFATEVFNPALVRARGPLGAARAAVAAAARVLRLAPG